MAVIFSNFLCDSGNLFGRSNIALVEGDIGGLDILTQILSKRDINLLTDGRLRRIEV